MTNKNKKITKEPINIIMHPIDNMQEYEKSLGTVMLDILEKKIGHERLSVVMEQLKKELGR